MENEPKTSGNSRYSERHIEPRPFDPEPTVALEKVTTPEDFLNAINFNVINDLFDSMARKSNASKDRVSGAIHPSLIDFSDVEPSGEEGVTLEGSFDPVTGRIKIFWDVIQETDGHSKAMIALHTLIHEAAHKRSHDKRIHDLETLSKEISEAQAEEEKAKILQRLTSQPIYATGLSETRIVGDKLEKIERKNLGRLLNEAVTEEVAIEVLAEYLRRTGELTLLRTTENLLASSGTPDYLYARIIFNMMVEEFAASLSVPSEEVMRGFVRAYLSGEQGPEEIMAVVADELKNMPDLEYIFKETLLNGINLPLTSERYERLKEMAPYATLKSVFGLNPAFVKNALKL